jgi:FkbM family methyltransferase
MVQLPALDIKNFGFVKTVPVFNINVLKPHIYGEGVIVYGAGNNCVTFMTMLYLRNIKANILCVADADKSKHGKSICGLPIVAIEELQKYNRETPILITPAKGFRQIADNLNSMRFSNLFYYDKMARECITFIDKYLQKNSNGKNYFNFGGALLPDIDDDELITLVKYVFSDTFLIPLFCGDNYDKSIVDILDLYMGEGPYGYTDGDFDVSVRRGDIVIDAGAWIGDFSAYAANKGAEVYAFEPTSETFALLEETAELNKPGKIYPVKKGLSDRTGTATIECPEHNTGSNSIVIHYTGKSEPISLTTLDAFAAENNIKKIDFIKADIEGAERDMLRGATNVLKTFAPKLAICTYHLPDDPMVLEDIILEANPKYKVVHLKMKLFACVT